MTNSRFPSPYVAYTLALMVAAVVGLFSMVGYAQQTTGTPGSPDATTTISGKQLPPPAPKFGGVIKDDALQIETVVAAARGAAQGRSQHPADHDRRRRLWRSEHVWRRHPDTEHGPHRGQRAALQPDILHLAVLADARRAHHRTQPSLGRLRRDFRAGHRLPRLRQRHRRGQRDDRPHSARQRLRDELVRQGSQHADLRGQPGRAVHPVADRHGLRLLLRLRRRRREPVGAESLPQHDADLPVDWSRGHLEDGSIGSKGGDLASHRQGELLEPGHRDGRRRH